MEKHGAIILEAILTRCQVTRALATIRIPTFVCPLISISARADRDIEIR